MATARVIHTDAGSRAQAEKPSRREFLYYVWGASMAMALGGTAAGLVWYMMPRPNRDDLFLVTPDNVPAIGSYIWIRTRGMHKSFYIAHTDVDTLVALSPFCTHLGCLVKWVELNHRFECPCHNQRYELNGNYINGVATRSLDRFPFTVTFADGTTAATNEAGDPIAIDGREIASVTVDTRRLIQRAGRE